jgi:hypothetical protein
MMLPQMIRLVAFISVLILCCSCCLNADNVEEAVTDLPKTSEEFFSLFSFKGVDDTVDLLQIDKGDAFKRWVIWSIHSANKPPWYIEDDAYARVFDLLDWARKQDMRPKPILIDQICHKGMEQQYFPQVDNGDTNEFPSQPNEYISKEVWTELWASCHKKLSSQARTASNCIDVPGIAVSSDSVNMPNNPCGKKYRLVDGAHRLCLRKYGLSLLKGEISELHSLLSRPKDKLDNSRRKEIIDHIAKKENMVLKYSHAMFLVLDQSTFESMLTHSDNPFRHHQQWAQTMHLSQKLKDDWKLWMHRVLVFVDEWRDHYVEDIPKEEL